MNFNTLKISDVKTQLVALVLAMRNKEQLSQEELANKIGVSRITIQNLEASKNITLDTLLKVLQYFNLLEKFHLFIQDEIDNTAIQSLY